MDTGKYKKLNKFHVIFLAHGSIGGIAVFSFPHYLRHIGYNMWMMLPIYCMIILVFLKVMTTLSNKYPNDTLYVINEKITGRVFGKLINFLILFYAAAQIANESQFYVRLVQSVTLPDFTLTGITITLFLVMIAIVNGGIKSIARFSILSFFLVIWTAYYSNWALADSNIHHLWPPRFEEGLEAWGAAFFEGSQLFLGIALLMFFYPYIIQQEKAFRHAATGVILGLLINIFICMVSIVFFSRWQIENLQYPVLNLFQAVELSNVERIETLGISLFVFLVLSKTALYLWVAKKGLDALLSKHKNKTRHLIFIAGTTLFFVLGPIPIRYKVIFYEKWIIYYGYWLILLPVFLLLLHKLKHWKKGNKGKEASA